MIRWQSSLNGEIGISIKSPLTGHVLPITSHPDLLYNTNILPAALCIELTHGTLLAPFSGSCEFSLLGERRVTMKHRSGLGVVIDLSPLTDSKPFAVRRLDTRSTISTGQPIATFDVSARGRQKYYAAVMLILPGGVSEILACERSVTAGVDPLIIIGSDQNQQR